MKENENLESDLPSTPRSGLTAGRAWFLLVCAAFLWIVPGTSDLPLLDRDEPRFARATVEMIERASWSVPYFNGEYRFDKPPMVYWGMRFFYSVFGLSEVGARSHSILATLLVAGSIFSFGRRLADMKRALAASLAWLMLIQTQLHGRLCVADMALLFFIMWAFRAVYELLAPDRDAKQEKRWQWILGVSLGCSVITKWPVAVALLIGQLILLRWPFVRQPLEWKRLAPIKTLVICGVISAAWGIPAYLATDGLFWTQGFTEHFVQRGVSPMNRRIPIPGFYGLTFWLSFFPWAFSFVFLLRRWKAPLSFSQGFLLAWAGSVYGLFSVAMTQLPHYVMPAFPALILILFCDLPAWAQGQGGLSGMPRFPGRFHGGLAVLFLILGGVVGMTSFPAGVGAIRDTLMLIAICFPLWQLAAWLLTRQRFVSVLAIGSLAAACFGWGSHWLRTLSPAVEMASRWRSLPADCQFYGCGYGEPSLVFYGGRHWDFVSVEELSERVASRTEGEPLGILFLERKRDLFKFLGERFGDPNLVWDTFKPEVDRSQELQTFLSQLTGSYDLHRVAGWNMATSEWVDAVWIELGLPE